MLYRPNFKSDYSCVDDIFKCRTINDIKMAVDDFIAVTEAVDGMETWMICRHLENSYSEWSKMYSIPHKGSVWNAVIVPPEHSPIMLLPSCVPFGGSPYDIITGLRKFIIRCDEFIPPKFDAITVTEIKRILTAAQKAYSLIDVIAPNEPMKILRFAYSHIIHNSQCGIPDDPTRASTIFVFHPKENDVYDRFFIFAHELGHALHLALTQNIDVIPDGFDKFNESVSTKLSTIKEKQEAFADAVALAILNIKGLRTHFPTQFSKYMSPIFARYVRGLTANIVGTAATSFTPTSEMQF